MDTPGKQVPKISVFNARTGKTGEVIPVNRTDAEWKAQLTPEQFSVARKQGTEYVFTGKYHALKEHGIYTCVCCGTDLFYRRPSLIREQAGPVSTPPVSRLNIGTHVDTARGMVRTEVLWVRCGAHLGQVFNNGSPH
jgi:peptide-methionine (R)-S-oxide reductase